MKLPQLPTRLRWLQVFGILLIAYPAYRSMTVLDGVMLHSRGEDKQANPTPCLSRLAKVDARWRSVERDVSLTVNPDHPGELSQYPEPVRKHLVTKAVLSHFADGQHDACMVLARKVDTQNALYPMLEANTIFAQAGIMRPTKKKPDMVQILKPEMMEKALPYAERAMRLPLLTDYAMDFNRYCVRGIDASSIRLTEQILAREEAFAPMSPDIKKLYQSFTSYYGKVMVWYAQNGHKEWAMKMAHSWRNAYLSRMNQPLYLQDALGFYNQVTQMLGDQIVTMKICGRPDLARKDEQFRDAWTRAVTQTHRKRVLKEIILHSGNVLTSILIDRLPTTLDDDQDNAKVQLRKQYLRYALIETKLGEPSSIAEPLLFERLLVNMLVLVLAVWIMVLLVLHRSDHKVDASLVVKWSVLALFPWVAFVWIHHTPLMIDYTAGYMPMFYALFKRYLLAAFLSLILPSIAVMWVQPKDRNKLGTIYAVDTSCILITIMPAVYIVDPQLVLMMLVKAALTIGIMLLILFRRMTFLANYTAVMVVLLLTLVCGVLPFLTASERQAWSRDKLLVNQQENLRDLERAAMHSFHSALIPVMQNYGGDIVPTTHMPQAKKERK